MPHSLRAKLSGLRYKGILEDKDYKRLCKALDNEDVLEKIRAEIADYKDDKIIHAERNEMIDIVLEIIDKNIQPKKIVGKLISVDVLEKIRAEIYQLHGHPKLDFIKNDEVVDMALDVIDKYR